MRGNSISVDRASADPKIAGVKTCGRSARDDSVITQARI
jgi:hypothetical protein